MNSLTISNDFTSSENSVWYPRSLHGTWPPTTDLYRKLVKRMELSARISWRFPKPPWFPGALRATVATHLNMSQILPISNTFPFVNPWVKPYVPLIFAWENIVTVFENKDSPGKVITSGLFSFWSPNFQLSSWLNMPGEHTRTSTYTDEHSHTHTYTRLQLWHICTHSNAYVHLHTCVLHTLLYTFTLSRSRGILFK